MNTSPFLYRRERGRFQTACAAASALLAAGCLLSGCLSRPNLNKQTFVFGSPNSTRDATNHSRRVVAIRTLRVAAPFDGRSLVYRTGEFAYRSDPYAEFLVSPSESLLFPIRNWMRGTGAFEAVIEPGSVRRPNTMAEIAVLQLYGDFRRSSEPAAFLTVRFVLFDSPNGIPGSLILDRNYSSHIPLKARTPGALMAGWNEGLNQILARLDSDVGGLEAIPAADAQPAGQ